MCFVLFCVQVKVMSSLRVPKRVTIRGNDEKEYMFWPWCVLFCVQVKVMSSLRVPKRVTIRGNDEKEYMFLALMCFVLFCVQVKVMSSLRVPKRVTIRGNDEKEYMFWPWCVLFCFVCRWRWWARCGFLSASRSAGMTRRNTCSGPDVFCFVLCAGEGDEIAAGS